MYTQAIFSHMRSIETFKALEQRGSVQSVHLQIKRIRTDLKIFTGCSSVPTAGIQQQIEKQSRQHCPHYQYPQRPGTAAEAAATAATAATTAGAAAARITRKSGSCNLQQEEH